MNENLYLYILMRTDLPSMGSGRAAAQASHAASAFAKKYGTTSEYKKWASNTDQGFGTAIVLAVDKRQLCDLNSMAENSNFKTDFITDPDYVITVPSELIGYIDDRRLGMFKPHPTDPSKYLFHREEITCAYIFGDKDALQPMIGHLPLYS